MNHEQEAAAIRADRPRQHTITPPPHPYVGYIRLQRRRDGGYLLSAMGYDEQAGQFNDGTLAAQIIGPEQVDVTAPVDLLAQALSRARDQLMQLRLEAAFQQIATLRADRTDQELMEMLREALQR